MSTFVDQPDLGSYRRAVAAHLAVEDPTAGWVVDTGEARSSSWIEAMAEGARLPGQGWKLHVSANPASAPEVLDRALPVLRSERATFKVAASPWHLERLNAGWSGPSQVGKFLTVYPEDDARAVRLADALDEVTTGLTGPRIPSDRQLRPTSLVHYRYGAFEHRWLQLATGEIVAALSDPDGRLVPDERRPVYRVPEWVTDPFVAAGVTTPPPPANLLVADRYLTVALLNNSARTAVRLALDIETGARLVLKHARRAAAADVDDEGFVRLRREAAFMELLADVPAVPELVGVLSGADAGDDLYLVMEHCEGTPLDRLATAAAKEGRHLPVDRVVAWVDELVSVVATIHDAGFVHGDLKPANVLASDDGLRLVDFETVTRRTDEGDAATTGAATGGAVGPGDRRDAVDAADEHDGIVGTLGFLSPQQVAGGLRTVADDVYSLGCLLFFLLTAAEPSDAPDPLDLLARPLRVLNPAVPPRLDALVRRCLRPEPAQRPSLDELRTALTAVVGPDDRGAGEAAVAVAAVTPHPDRAAPPDLGELVAHLERSLTASLAALCDPAPGEPARRDVHDGVAGLVLVLSDAAASAGTREPLRRAARWLAATEPLPGGPLAGLHAGEAGVGAALLRAGVALDDEELVRAAADRGRLVASLPHRSPDLFNGTAGRVRFHLALAGATGDDEHRRHAEAAGAHLLATRSGAAWPMPAGYGMAEGTTLFGYAHGAAGIGDVLVDLACTTGDERYVAAVGDVALDLIARALPALDDGRGVDWVTADGGERLGPFWCHGAAGIGRFLLRAAALTSDPAVEATALAAVRTAAHGARWAGPGQCHGLAGNADVVVDAYLATGDRAWLDELDALTRLLAPFVVGLDDDARLTPGFASGRAGILAFLRRLASAVPGPHVLDLAALGRGVVVPAVDAP